MKMSSSQQIFKEAYNTFSLYMQQDAKLKIKFILHTKQQRNEIRIVRNYYTRISHDISFIPLHYTYVILTSSPQFTSLQLTFHFTSLHLSSLLFSFLLFSLHFTSLHCICDDFHHTLTSPDLSLS
jgi:hypothetical protein